MKTTITPYVRPDGIIVGIKGKAPEKPTHDDFGNKLDNLPQQRYMYEDMWNKSLTAFIQSGHAFEDQEWAFKELAAFIEHGIFLPQIELDVEEVENIQDPCTQCGSTAKEQSRGCNEIACYKGRPGFNRTVLRIAKEEVKPEEATETQEELWDEVYNNGILWYRQELIHEYLLKQFTIQRKTK